jgi:hypothetical protein
MGHQAEVRCWRTIFASLVHNVYRNPIHQPTTTTRHDDAKVPPSQESQTGEAKG